MRNFTASIFATFLLVLSFQATAKDKEQLKKGADIVKEIIAILNNMHPTDGKLSAAQKSENEAHKDRIGSFIDIDTMSRDALAKHYAKQAAPKIKDFKNLFKKIVVRSASSKSSSNKVKIKIRRKKWSKKKTVLIKTKVRRRGDDPVFIEYELKQNPKGILKIVDLILDEESVMENYRSQFNEIITKNNFDELLKRLRKNVNTGKKAKKNIEKI